MSVPVSQMWAVSSYVLRQIRAGRRRYPLVLMLEPLLRCNLACAGCGKIQYPGHILKREMPVEGALAAANECGTPVVSVAGGEPLMHSRIVELVEGLVAQGRYVYLCTNALLLKQKLDAGLFKPSKLLTFSVHMDGDEEAHDYAVCREGVYTEAEAAIRQAVAMGFRVTTNTTLFDHVDARRMRGFFDRMMDLGVESMTISPGYSYQKAPDQEHFLTRNKTWNLFRDLFKGAKKTWRFNHSPLFLEYLMGRRHFECTPWGNPCFTMFGWQRPCYLLQEGYAETLADLLDKTDWDRYGRASGNPKCQDCMVHCGHEPTAVHHTFGALRGFADTVRATVVGAFDTNRRPSGAPPPVTRHCETGLEAVKQAGLERDLHRAFDYRGDVTLTLDDGGMMQGYVSNVDADAIACFVDGGAEPLRIPRARIRGVSFSGVDHAEGKSWEAWAKKYHAGKATTAV